MNCKSCEDTRNKGTKKCSLCGEHKYFTCFDHNSFFEDSHLPRCKDCIALSDKKMGVNEYLKKVYSVHSTLTLFLSDREWVIGMAVDHNAENGPSVRVKVEDYAFNEARALIPLVIDRVRIVVESFKQKA